jgi:hypothetical protein
VRDSSGSAGVAELRPTYYNQPGQITKSFILAIPLISSNSSKEYLSNAGYSAI